MDYILSFNRIITTLKDNLQGDLKDNLLNFLRGDFKKLSFKKDKPKTALSTIIPDRNMVLEDTNSKKIKIPDYTNLIEKELLDVVTGIVSGEIWLDPNGIKDVRYIFAWKVPHLVKGNEYHIVKERILYNNGTIKPNLKYLKNYKIPVWVTKDIFRDHKQKKEFESVDKLKKFMTTEADRVNTVARAIGMTGYRRNNRRDVIDSPYVYGLDIDSRVFLKRAYLEKYGDSTIPIKYAALDTENDIATGDLTLITIATFEKIITIGVRSFYKKLNKSDESIVKMIKDTFFKNFVESYKYDGEVKFSKFIDLQVKIADNPADAIIKAFEEFHKWDIDMLGIWSIMHDMKLMVKTLEDAHIEPVDVFSTPSIPKPLRFFKVKEGDTKRRKEDGTEVAMSAREQWHTIMVSASYYILDAMSTYNFVRTGANDTPGGYGLDNILKTHVDMSKMKLNLYPELAGAQWHNMVSKKYPIEYSAYNIGDTYPMLILENKIQDVTVSAPVLSMSSSLDKFNSSPKKIVDELFLDALSAGKVGSTKPKKWEESLVMSPKHWIITLEAFRNVTPGLKIIKENKKVTSNFKGNVLDEDATSSYPSNGAASNLSRDTTRAEIIAIEGKPVETFKEQNMNLMYGKVNAGRYCRTMYNMPTTKSFLFNAKK